jgi:soluble lytic murein transglycosylase-like protein
MRLSPARPPIPLTACALGVGLAMAAPDQGRADDFTFRRIAVADLQPGRRITVQIDPEAQARRMAAPAPAPVPADPPPAAAAIGAHAWFWDRVSPLRQAAPGRWFQALAALDAPPPGGAVPQPELAALARIAAAHAPELLRTTVGTRVSPALALAVIAVESAGRPRAVSPAGAQGLMQIIPATAERFGVGDAFDPAQNIRGGVAYLDWLMGAFDGDAILALAAYNAGEGAVRRAGGVPPHAETRDYVPRVLAAWRVARGLCRTPPELPGDGCVFVLPETRAQATTAPGS